MNRTSEKIMQEVNEKNIYNFVLENNLLKNLNAKIYPDII